MRSDVGVFCQRADLLCLLNWTTSTLDFRFLFESPGSLMEDTLLISNHFPTQELHTLGIYSVEFSNCKRSASMLIAWILFLKKNDGDVGFLQWSRRSSSMLRSFAIALVSEGGDVSVHPRRLPNLKQYHSEFSPPKLTNCTLCSQILFHRLIGCALL
jgi:hypothetical protein